MLKQLLVHKVTIQGTMSLVGTLDIFSVSVTGFPYRGGIEKDFTLGFPGGYLVGRQTLIPTHRPI